MTRQLSRAGAVLFAIFLIATALVVAPAPASAQGGGGDTWQIYRTTQKAIYFHAIPEGSSGDGQLQHVYCVDAGRGAPLGKNVTNPSRYSRSTPSYESLASGIGQLTQPGQAQKTALGIAIARELTKAPGDRVNISPILNWNDISGTAVNQTVADTAAQSVAWRLGWASSSGKRKADLGDLPEPGNQMGRKIAEAVTTYFDNTNASSRLGFKIGVNYYTYIKRPVSEVVLQDFMIAWFEGPPVTSTVVTPTTTTQSTTTTANTGTTTTEHSGTTATE
ncbi:hypothetical protein KRX55_11700, partial [Corynebacterium sp. TAE3-ERU16]